MARHTRPLRALLFCPVLACGGSLSGGHAVGYTLQFEPVTTTAPASAGVVPTRALPFGDGFVAFNYDLSITDGAGGWTTTATLDHALGATVLDGTIYALLNGGVAASTDGTTFTEVSDRALTGLAAVDGVLLGVELVDAFSMQVVRSTDQAATWTPTGVVVTILTLEIGSFTANFVGTGPDTAFVRFLADADLGDNVSLVTELWQLDGTGTGSKIGDSLLEPAPTATTADGFAVVELGAAVNTLNEPYARLPIAYSKGFDPKRAVEDYVRVNYVSAAEIGGPVAASLLGVDDDGHLLLAAEGGVMRSTTPVGPAGDRADAVALGPGCADWVDRAVLDSDQLTVNVVNESGEALRIRTIDSLNRWALVQELAPGASAALYGLGVREQALLMAVGADGVCFGVYAIPNKSDDGITWTVKTRR